MRFWAPFEVLNVDMDKDPIQTAEDLFAHIFEIAEKVKTDQYIYCLKNTLCPLWMFHVHIYGTSLDVPWYVHIYGTSGTSGRGCRQLGERFSRRLSYRRSIPSAWSRTWSPSQSLTLLASGEIFCHWSKFCDKKLWHFPSLVNVCESSLWRWELFRLFIPILPEIFVPGGGKKMGDICTWRRTIKR